MAQKREKQKACVPWLQRREKARARLEMVCCARLWRGAACVSWEGMRDGDLSDGSADADASHNLVPTTTTLCEFLF